MVSLIASELVARFVVVLACEAVVPESEVLKIEGPPSAVDPTTSTRVDTVAFTADRAGPSNAAKALCRELRFVSLGTPELAEDPNPAAKLSD